MEHEVNPPVRRIIFIGPRREVLRHAGALYRVCRERRQIPALYAKRTLLGVAHRIRTPIVRTGIITVGPRTEALFRRVRQKLPCIKALCLLEPGAPRPEFYFSYRHQVFPCPESAGDYGIIASWMGLSRCPAEGETFTEELRRAIPAARLEQEATRWND